MEELQAEPVRSERAAAPPPELKMSHCRVLFESHWGGGLCESGFSRQLHPWHVRTSGLFLKTLSSSRFRSTACKWEVWDFAMDLTGVKQVLLVKSFFTPMQCTEEGDREVCKDYLPGWISLSLLGLPFLVLPCFLVFVNMVLLIKANIDWRLILW